MTPSGRGSGDEVPQKLKNFKSSYKQISRIFCSISHIFTYISCLFSVLAGIIPLSLRNGGTFNVVCPPPLSASGATAPGCAAYGQGSVFQWVMGHSLPMTDCLLCDALHTTL